VVRAFHTVIGRRKLHQEEFFEKYFRFIRMKVKKQRHDDVVHSGN
jgi:hypothetical protein